MKKKVTLCARAHTHKHTHTHTHARTYTHAHTRTRTRTHARAHTHAYTHTNTHTRTHTRTNTHKRTRTRTHARTHARKSTRKSRLSHCCVPDIKIDVPPLFVLACHQQVIVGKEKKFKDVLVERVNSAPMTNDDVTGECFPVLFPCLAGEFLCYSLRKRRQH